LRFRGAVRAVQAQRALPPRPDTTVTATGADNAAKLHSGSTQVAFGEFAKLVDTDDPRHQMLENLRRTEQQAPPPPLPRKTNAPPAPGPASQLRGHVVESEAAANAEEGHAPPPKKTSSRPGWGVRAVREALSRAPAALVSASAEEKAGEKKEKPATLEPEPEPEPGLAPASASAPEPEPEPASAPAPASAPEPKTEPAVVEADREPELVSTTTEPEPQPEATGKKRFGLF
jgi:hypothetical protein